MSTCPIHKVVANRPPTDTLNGNMRHRSSTQVKKDLEAKIAAKAVAEWSINTAKNQQQACIANLEDILWKEDLLQEKQSIRPNLQAYAKLEPVLYTAPLVLSESTGLWQKKKFCQILPELARFCWSLVESAGLQWNLPDSP